MITFDNLTKEKIDTKSLRKLAKTIFIREGVGVSEKICCVFTNDKYIKRLNRQYRNRDYPTDVLAFSFVEGVGADFRNNQLGDIYISTDTAKENAKRFAVTFSYEIKLLFIHGLLHLLNYDDNEELGKKKMEQEERYYISLIEEKDS